ncbi:MAG: hypothetical protein AW09_000832 [Candidatus Accumulibacter phosphatis]|uniref:Uncharacterized protein n=1 Tax=Candidatus Accumulibacter phosphatis TaxID=327160 RepID=A0A080LY93_9PROT|nr:hypothetical protein [Accumulibacter sp.]KFB73892.1 MAG: hypothetical protein AW09_000832 [Candidatus Accumulibacter phosphatis]HRE87317.1 hypothetical protein [Accumulibacter sp.]
MKPVGKPGGGVLSVLPCVLAISMLLALAGCGTLLPPIELASEPPRLAIAPPAPDADKLMACFGRRLARYVDSRPGDAPPVIVEVAGFFNRNPATLQRLELPTDATTLLESLLTSVGPALAFRETRRDAAAERGAPASTLKVKNDIQIVEASARSRGRFFDFSFFKSDYDASTRDGEQSSVAAITLEMSAVAPDGLGRHGWGAPLRIAFERSQTRESSLAASFSSIALGFNQQTRVVNGYGHALRVGAALQLVSVLSRATMVGANPCVQALIPERADTLPLEIALREFRGVQARSPEGAAFWLNKLRALHGRPARDPLRLDAASATPAAVLAAVGADSDVGRVIARGSLDDRPLSALEKEFAFLWGSLPEVDAEVFASGFRWIDAVEVQLRAADLKRRPGGNKVKPQAVAPRPAVARAEGSERKASERL